MKIKDLLAELKESASYNEFISKYPNAHLCAGFFVLSKEEKEGDKFQLDFLLPEQEQMTSFEYPFNTYKIHEDKIQNVEKIKDLDLNVDLDQIKERTKKEFNKDFTKIIAIFQNKNWNLTCIDGIDIKRLKFNAYTNKVESSGDLKMTDIMRFEKTSKQ